MVVGCTITYAVVSGEVYVLVQHYVLKFVNDQRQVSGFLWKKGICKETIRTFQCLYTKLSRMKENMHMRSKIYQEFYHGIVIYIYIYIVILLYMRDVISKLHFNVLIHQ
jgi:hypothetical protein